MTALRSAAPTTKDAGPMADPWIILAVIPRTDDSTPKLGTVRVAMEKAN